MFIDVTNATVFTIVEQSFQTHHGNYCHKYVVVTLKNTKCRCFTRLSNAFAIRIVDGGLRITSYLDKCSSCFKHSSCQSVTTCFEIGLPNFVTQNRKKAELLWLMTPRTLKKFSKVSITDGSAIISQIPSARCLDLVLDDEICRSRYCQLRQLRRFHRYLNFDLASTFVTSAIDYCNGLLSAAPKYQIDELQRIQNSTARLLHKLPRFECLLRSMVEERIHWLRIPERITKKLCTSVFKSIHGLAAHYLSELCKPTTDSTHRRYLR